jgi:hypothetical protein
MSFGIRPDLTRLLDSRYTFDLPWSREEAKYGPATNSINSPLGSSTTQPSPTPLPEEADALSMTPSAVQVSLAQARLDESRPDEGHNDNNGDLDDLAGILVGLSKNPSKLPKSSSRKKRRRTSPDELDILENTFKVHPMPNQALRQQLAQKLGMTPRRVQIWFQNKRAKLKRCSQDLPGSPARSMKEAQDSSLDTSPSTVTTTPTPTSNRGLTEANGMPSVSEKRGVLRPDDTKPGVVKEVRMAGLYMPLLPTVIPATAHGLYMAPLPPTPVKTKADEATACSSGANLVVKAETGASMWERQLTPLRRPLTVTCPAPNPGSLPRVLATGPPFQGHQTIPETRLPLMDAPGQFAHRLLPLSQSCSFE